jgi:hypothetical protein
MTNEHGPLETATRTAISEMGELNGINRPLAELCINLSRLMDVGASGMAASAIARELRETLTQMMEVSDDNSAVRDLLDRLSVPVLTEVRNAKKA